MDINGTLYQGNQVRADNLYREFNALDYVGEVILTEEPVNAAYGVTDLLDICFIVRSLIGNAADKRNGG